MTRALSMVAMPTILAYRRANTREELHYSFSVSILPVLLNGETPR